uniref:Putative WD repeat-containing protein 43 n=1 Tax=Davidia involucrata TaxID=16924 RepID=A0A5B6YPR2_DAVIN
MAREKLKSLITSFTPEGDYLAILSPNGVVKVWNTSDGSLFADWKQSDGDSDVSFSYMACSFVGKKRRKESATFLLALGTNAGEILSINVLTGERTWKSTECHPGGIAGLFFANRGRSLYIVGSNGMTSEMNSETGERVREFKASKTVISSACSCGNYVILVLVHH